MVPDSVPMTTDDESWMRTGGDWMTAPVVLGSLNKEVKRPKQAVAMIPPVAPTLAAVWSSVYPGWPVSRSTALPVYTKMAPNPEQNARMIAMHDSMKRVIPTMAESIRNVRHRRVAMVEAVLEILSIGVWWALSKLTGSELDSDDGKSGDRDGEGAKWMLCCC